MSTIYTVGDGKRTQCAQRQADGVWFIRRKWRGQWGKWTEVGRQRPFEFGMYKAPRCGNAVLPINRSDDDEKE